MLSSIRTATYDHITIRGSDMPIARAICHTREKCEPAASSIYAPAGPPCCRNRLRRMLLRQFQITPCQSRAVDVCHRQLTCYIPYGYVRRVDERIPLMWSTSFSPRLSVMSWVGI